MPARAERCASLGVLLAALTAPDARASDARGAERGPYLHPFGSIAIGRGLRLNNPYRLSTELGNGGESLSLSATYVDLAAAISFGPPDGFQHGFQLDASIAWSGIPQTVLAPSYVLVHRVPTRSWLWGRAGIPLVMDPDFTGGIELAAGGAFLVSASLGVTAELVGDVFYGAGTEQRAITTIPVVSLELGLYVDWEVLP